MNIDQIVEDFSYEDYGAALYVTYISPMFLSRGHAQERVNIKFRQMLTYANLTQRLLDEIEGYSYRTADMWRFPEKLIRINTMTAPSYSFPSKSHGLVVSRFHSLLDYILDILIYIRNNDRYVHKREIEKIKNCINRICHMVYHEEDRHFEREIGRDLSGIDNHIFFSLSPYFEMTYEELYTDHLMTKVGREVIH